MSGRLLDIHEGDGMVVNVVCSICVVNLDSCLSKIEQHPSLPILSVSGIDNTVKVRIMPYFKG